MKIAGLRSISFAVLLVCSRELAAIGPSECRQSRTLLRHRTKSARALLRARQMHSTIRRRIRRGSLARYFEASRSKK